MSEPPTLFDAAPDQADEAAGAAEHVATQQQDGGSTHSPEMSDNGHQADHDQPNSAADSIPDSPADWDDSSDDEPPAGWNPQPPPDEAADADEHTTSTGDAANWGPTNNSGSNGNGSKPTDRFSDRNVARAANSRKVHLSRDGDHFQLAFPYDKQLVDRARKLPFAKFDPHSKAWTCRICTQAVNLLRGWYWDGLLDASPDDLLDDTDTLTEAPDALLRAGTRNRPFVVETAWRDDRLFSRLRSLPTYRWEKKLGACTYGPQAAAALANLVDRGVLADPDGLLTASTETGIIVMFDVRSGKFVLRGDDRAQARFDQYFPMGDPERNPDIQRIDVIEAWRNKGIEVEFADQLTEEVYHGELARAGDGLQPDDLHADLYPFQALNVAVASARSGLLVADEPGLGKTITGIAAGLIRLGRKQADRIVVVCPGAVRTQWAREIERFTDYTIDNGDIIVVDGSKDDRYELYERGKNAKWVVVHYDVLHRDIKRIMPLARGCYLVADEVHRAKNPQAKRTKSVRAMARKAVGQLGLTGTPVESNPSEWHAVLSGFCTPGVLGDWTSYAPRYMFANRWGGYEGAKNLDELAQRSRPHFMRHTKDQVADHLPPLRVKNLVLDPDPTYAAVLRRAHQQARDEIAAAALERNDWQLDGLFDGDEFEQLAGAAEMTAVGMLRRLCISPKLVAESESDSAKALKDAGIIPDVDGPKLDELRGVCTELRDADQRVVIFTASKTMANLIAERLTEDDVEHVLYTGDTRLDDREQAVARFTDPQDDVVAFIATDAAAEGLNLGRCCQILINVDVPWTPTRLEQRSNRIHRLDGTHDQYLVINLTIRGTLEEGILKMVGRKADLMDAIFSETGARERTVGSKTRVRHNITDREELATSDHTASTCAPQNDQTQPQTAEPAEEPVVVETSDGQPDTANHTAPDRNSTADADLPNRTRNGNDSHNNEADDHDEDRTDLAAFLIRQFDLHDRLPPVAASTND